MENLEYSSEDTETDSSENPENEEIDHHNLKYSQMQTEEHLRLIQESTLVHLSIDQNKNELEEAIHQLEVLDNELEHLKQTQDNFQDEAEMYHVVFKLNEDEEVDRLKEFYQTKEALDCTRLDLNFVPQNSKPVIKFLESHVPKNLDSFCFNKEGKYISIDKYIKSLFKNISNVAMSFSINYCVFDTISLKYLVERGTFELSHLKLLDLSHCHGISLQIFVAGMGKFVNLNTLIMHHCGLGNEPADPDTPEETVTPSSPATVPNLSKLTTETSYLKELFLKAPNLIYLDLRYNHLDPVELSSYVHLVPDLHYLFLQHNSSYQSGPTYESLLRKNQYTGLIDPWTP